MPVITVTLIEGYDAEAKRRLCERLTDASMAVIAAPAEAVTVIVNEVAPSGYMRGRQAKTPGRALPPAADVCLSFLDAVAARDLDRAGHLTDEGFEMVFPGGQVFTAWQALLDWAASRYSRIEKRIARVEEAPLGARMSVYVSGTLEGERPDGTAFSGVRFIDRFELENGRIVRQEVWNDLAEVFAKS